MSTCDQLKIQGLFWRAIFFIPPSFSCPFYLAAEIQEWRFWGGCTVIFPSPLNQGYTEPNLQDHEGSNKAVQKLEEMWMMENSERIEWHTQPTEKWLCQCPAWIRTCPKSPRKISLGRTLKPNCTKPKIFFRYRCIPLHTIIFSLCQIF